METSLSNSQTAGSQAVTHKESVREPYLEEAFAILDDDNSGKVTLGELLEFGESVLSIPSPVTIRVFTVRPPGKFTGNQHWSEQEMADLLKTIDKDGDKALSMNEFKVGGPHTNVLSASLSLSVWCLTHL